MWWFFFVFFYECNFIENCQNSKFFARICWNVNFLCSWHFFFKCVIPLQNYTIISLKIAKLVSNCQNMNFICCYFFFLFYEQSIHIYFSLICYYLTKNQQNSRLLLKYELLLWLICFKKYEFLHIYFCKNTLFYWKSAKFTIFWYWLSKCKLSSWLIFYKYVFPPPFLIP